jgi:hypothetical protein
VKREMDDGVIYEGKKEADEVRDADFFGVFLLPG